MRFGEIFCRRLSLALATVLSLALASSAYAGPYSAPAEISPHYPLNVGLGIDGDGNALATWIDANDDSVYFSDRLSGGVWTAEQSFLRSGSDATLQVSPSGRASIISYDMRFGIYSTDRPAHGVWKNSELIVSTPNLVTPGFGGAPQVQFVANAKGDQAVIFVELVAGAPVISAMRRPAGADWGAPYPLVPFVPSRYLDLSSAAMGNNGDLLVVYESGTIACKNCPPGNYMIYAARNPPTDLSWSVSPALNNTGRPNQTIAVMTPKGRAGVFLLYSTINLIQAVSQPDAGSSWSVPSLVFSYSDIAPDIQWIGAAATGGDSATVAFNLSGFAASPAAMAINGNFAAETWSAPIILSIEGTLPTGALIFAANSSGSAVAARQAGTMLSSTNGPSTAIATLPTIR